MSESGAKKSGEDPPDNGNKRPRGPADCLEDSSDDEVFTPFTQENPAIVWPEETTKAKRSVKKARKNLLGADDGSKPVAKQSDGKKIFAKKSVAKRSVAKNSLAKNSLAKNRVSTPSKGKCLGKFGYFGIIHFNYFCLLFVVMGGYNGFFLFV